MAKSNKQTKIAVIGIRGIPVIYSGFESFIEKLAPDLVKKRFNLIVYCRSKYSKTKRRLYQGVKLIYLPTIYSKYFETFIHSLLATLHACFFLRPNLIYYLGVGNAPFIMLSRLFKIKTIINVDGLDWRREKWNWIARQYLRFSQLLTVFPPNKIITDSKYMQRYYLEYYKKETVYIPYGFYPEFKENKKILKKYNLETKKYFVWVGRIVPDNHLEELLNAFIKLKTSYKCVIIGDSNHEDDYRKKIQKLVNNDKRMIYTGFLSRNDYATLIKHTYCYVETKRSGGSHPSLIEAVGYGCHIISNSHSANKEILGANASYYDYKIGSKDLFRKITKINNITNKNNISLINSEQFNHNNITLKYYSLFKQILNN